MADKTIEMTELLKDSPKNWGRWGANDEIGCLNFLTSDEVLRGVRAVKQGKVFMLGVPVARPEGDPTHPIRAQPIHTLTHDEGFYLERPRQAVSRRTQVFRRRRHDVSPGDYSVRRAWPRLVRPASYIMAMIRRRRLAACRNARFSRSRDHGVIGRGILIDAARYKGKKHLDRGEGVTLDDLLGAAKKQGVDDREARYHRAAYRMAQSLLRRGPKALFPDGHIRRAGLEYSKELVKLVA